MGSADIVATMYTAVILKFEWYIQPLNSRTPLWGRLTRAAEIARQTDKRNVTILDVPIRPGFH